MQRARHILIVYESFPIHFLQLILFIKKLFYAIFNFSAAFSIILNKQQYTLRYNCKKQCEPTADPLIYGPFVFEKIHSSNYTNCTIRICFSKVKNKIKINWKFRTSWAADAKAYTQPTKGAFVLYFYGFKKFLEDNFIFCFL